MCALRTALKASARFLWAARVTLLLEIGVLDSLFVEGFFGLCGSAAGGTCSLFCFFPILSKPSNSVSDILIGTETKKERRWSIKQLCDKPLEFIYMKAKGLLIAAADYGLISFRESK